MSDEGVLKDRYIDWLRPGWGSKAGSSSLRQGAAVAVCEINLLGSRRGA